MVEFDAIWDTGATGSVITQTVVDACGLVATGMTVVHHVDGESQQETYLVNIALPNQVGYSVVPVTKGDLGAGADVLIGMNIINAGDFAVTNFDGITKFSFRVPSVGHIDFVEDGKTAQSGHNGEPSGNRRSRRAKSKGKGNKRRGTKRR